MKPLRLTDCSPPCLDTIIEFSDLGYVQIITEDDESDTFTLTIDRANKIIEWLNEWKHIKREAGDE